MAKELQIPIARLILDDQGFGQVRMAPAERHTLADAKALLASNKKLCDGQLYPNLVAMRATTTATKRIRWCRQRRS